VCSFGLIERLAANGLLIVGQVVVRGQVLELLDVLEPSRPGVRPEKGEDAILGWEAVRVKVVWAVDALSVPLQ
jgi:hypothetical protein